MEETQQEAGCYQCGSPDGTLLVLCPECAGKNDNKRHNLRGRLAIDQSGEADPFFYRLAFLESGPTLVVVGVFLAMLLIALMVGTSMGVDFAVMVVALTGFTAVLVTVVSWILLWLEAKASGSDLATASLMFPPLLYLYIWRARSRGRDAPEWIQVKNFFVAHCVGIVLSLSALLACNSIGVKIPTSVTVTRPKVTSSW